MSLSSSRSGRRLLGAATLAIALGVAGAALPPRPALAEPTAAEFQTARELFKQGTRLRAAGDLPGAIEKFRAADELVRTAITGLELAKTEAQAGQLVEAR